MAAKKIKKDAPWETYIKSLGFKWNKEKEHYVKPGNFGSQVTVEMLFKKLFHVAKNNEVIHSNFVWTFDEFKTIIEKAIK